MTITFTVNDPSGAQQPVEVAVNRAFNFGYAGRSIDEVQAHVEELKDLGFQAPARTPSIYPIDPALISHASTISVRGSSTYGEVEFALIVTDPEILVGIASDHSDMAIEGASTAHAKTLYPDLVSPELWRYADVAMHWDALTMRCERLGVDGWETIQDGPLSLLLAPEALLAELRERSGETNSPGTVLVSGTIGGELRPGADAWRHTLTDPVLGRSLVLEYRVLESPIEI